MIHLKSPMLRFLFGHGVIGGGAGVAIAVSLLAFDIAGLASLSTMSEPTWLGPFLLCFSFFASFSALAMGAAVMSFGGETHDDDDSGTTVLHRIVPDPEEEHRGDAERAFIKVRK